MNAGTRRGWRWANYAEDARLLTAVVWALLGGVSCIVFCYALAAWLIPAFAGTGAGQ